jgi:hypothetical protein
LWQSISSGFWLKKFFSSDFLRQSSAMHIRIRPNFPGLGSGLSLLQARIDGSLRSRFNDFEQLCTFALKEITARRDSTHEKDLHSMDDRRRIRRL